MNLKKVANESGFIDILLIIQHGRNRALQFDNCVLVETNWSVGQYLSRKVSADGWDNGVMVQLASWLKIQSPHLKGYSASNLWRMMQFYDTYCGQEKLAPVVRELSWSKHLIVMAECKTIKEKEFYLISAIRGNWSQHKLLSKIKHSDFERTMLADKKPMSALSHNTSGIFKDTYLLDFLGVLNY